MANSLGVSRGIGAPAASPSAVLHPWTVAAGTLSATGAFAGYTYIVTFLRDVSGFPPASVGSLLVVFGVACLAGAAVTGALLDRFPQSALTSAVAVQAAALVRRANRVPVLRATLRMFPGGHDWDTWRPAFRWALASAGAPQRRTR